MMVKNKILERMRNGEKALGVSLVEPSEIIVELAGRMGLDFVQFDGQHAPLTPEKIGVLCAIADGFDITPAMRVPDQGESTILSYLDKGIRLIVVPNLQTRAEAEALVKYTYFAPIGLRSSTSIRTVFCQEEGDRKRLFEEVNANTMLVPQLESITSLENVDELLSVDGIDFFTPGFEDQAQSMGLVGQHNHPKVQEAWTKGADRVRGAGKHILGDHIETVDVFGLVLDSAQALLEKHGRTSAQGF